MTLMERLVQAEVDLYYLVGKLRARLKQAWCRLTHHHYGPTNSPGWAVCQRCGTWIRWMGAPLALALLLGVGASGCRDTTITGPSKAADAVVIDDGGFTPKVNGDSEFIGGGSRTQDGDAQFDGGGLRSKMPQAPVSYGDSGHLGN